MILLLHVLLFLLGLRSPSAVGACLAAADTVADPEKKIRKEKIDFWSKKCATFFNVDIDYLLPL